jgi:hypothetical protein
MMPDDLESFEQWIKQNPPPDLQALAERYGGLGRVPPEEWQRFDEAKEAWERRRRARLTRGSI